MGTPHAQNDWSKLAPPEGTPQHARYMRYVRLWTRVKERTAVLQGQLDHLQAEIAANIGAASTAALVLASERADRLAIDTLDVAQLTVFADYFHQRLTAFVT